MHLMVVTQRKFRRTAEGMQTHDSFAIQIDALAPYFSRVTLSVPVFDDPTFKGIRLEAGNIDVQALPNYKGRLGFLFAWPRIKRTLLNRAKDADVALVLMPGYFASCTSWALQRRRLPVFHWVVSDWKAFARARRKDKPLPVRLWTALWTAPLDAITKRVTDNTLNFVNGRPTHTDGHTFPRLSSPIRERDIYAPDPATPTPPYRGVYVGRLADEKGVLYALRALSHMHDIDATLDIIGSGEAEHTLLHQAKELGVDQRVTFHGRLPREETHRRLRRAHVLVLPSLMDQQPRVLMEAMLHGVPVVATDVGFVSSVVTHEANGLLVPPADAEGLAKAMRRVLTDSALRRTLIEQGLEFVREHTIEKETKRMIATFDGYFPSLNRGTMPTS